MKKNKSIVVGTIITAALVLLTAPTHAQAGPTPDVPVSVSVRHFRINIPEEQLGDLRRRVLATRWPQRETVTDQSQGVQLAQIKALVKYWGTTYNWRKVEAKLNALPQFKTTIDGLDIHFIHVRSLHQKCLANHH